MKQQVVLEEIPLDLSFSTPTEMMALYKNKQHLIVMEQYVNIWIRQIEEVGRKSPGFCMRITGLDFVPNYFVCGICRWPPQH